MQNPRIGWEEGVRSSTWFIYLGYRRTIIVGTSDALKAFDPEDKEAVSLSIWYDLFLLEVLILSCSRSPSKVEIEPNFNHHKVCVWGGWGRSFLVGTDQLGRWACRQSRSLHYWRVWVGITYEYDFLILREVRWETEGIGHVDNRILFGLFLLQIPILT